MNSDFKDLLVLLDREEVRYLIVGGYAVIHYSQPRYTKNLDILVEPSAENARKLMAVFNQFGLSTFGLSQADFEQEGTQLNVGMPPVAIDILTSVPGLDFSECWKRRTTEETSDVPAVYLSKGDLLRAKRTAGRTQDLADIEEIERADD